MEMAIVPWLHNNKTNTDKTSACYLCMLYVQLLSLLYVQCESLVPC